LSIRAQKESVAIEPKTLIQEAPGEELRMLPLLHVVSVDSLTIEAPAPTFYLRYGKRLLDVTVSAVAIALLSPLFLAISVMIWLEDRSAVLYRQIRVGKDGEPFTFVKFRTMRPDADRVRSLLLGKSDAKGAAFKMKSDPRITRVGKWLRRSSLDELPQLFDVFLGRMSVVGPRPHLPEEVRHYTSDQWIRLQVKPGLFCIREVSGRSELDFDQWLKLDAEYVHRQSFWLDLSLILRLVPAVISGRGAY
jgi:lipopolysaccharide/colanic/teichoic acid biosynthesis glycosyltransferase